MPHAGRYDGTVGVLGGLEAIRSLQRGGFKPQRSIELIMFTSEEPTRFGIGCLGSRLLSCTLTPEVAALLKDNEGKSLPEVLTHAGMAGSLANVPLPQGHYRAFIELHIEQGPVLERKEVPIGIVTAIAAPATMRITVEGMGGHAGAVLMPERRDAFLAAAEIALAVEAAAMATRARDSVATGGHLQCVSWCGEQYSEPRGAGRGCARHRPGAARRNAAGDSGRVPGDGGQAAGARTNGRAQCGCPGAIEYGDCRDAVAESCQTLGIDFIPMVSRAYHDTLFVSRIAPAAMVFIPCRNGVSHRPDEYASPEDIARGVQVLAHSLAQLSS